MFTRVSVMDRNHSNVIESIWLVLIIMFTTAAGQQDTACSATNRANNLAGCLNDIRQTAENSSLFWFGSVAVAACASPHLMYTISCFNTHQGIKTLSELTFGVQGMDLSKLDRYVDLTYTSGPGEYVGCDYHYVRNSTITFSVDPLSSSSYMPWDLRTEPEMMWDAVSTDLFTLIVIDVGHGWLHGFYVNIRGSNISSADVVDSYHGPRNMRDILNPYAFVLFKQAAAVNKDSIYLPPFTPMNISSVVSTYQLGDLVGLSWVLASNDAYATQFAANVGYGQNCAELVAAAYQNHTKRPFLPDQLQLSVFLRLRISQNAATVPCGTEPELSYPAVDYYVDPIGLPYVKTFNARTEATLTFSMQMNKLFPNNTVDFVGKQYSLVVVDPDIPASHAAGGTNERPLLHGLTINIKGDDVNSGTIVKSYIGPGPPNNARHYYYFLLYEQVGTLVLENSTAPYSAGTVEQCLQGRLMDRCLFNVTSFVATNNLTLVGATWLTATNDEYVTCSNMPSGGTSHATAVMPKTIGFLAVIVLTLNLFSQVTCNH